MFASFFNSKNPSRGKSTGSAHAASAGHSAENRKYAENTRAERGPPGVLAPLE